MGNGLSLEAYRPFQSLLFPAPHRLRGWSGEEFESGSAGVPPYTVRTEPLLEWTGPKVREARWVIHCHGNATDVEGMDAQVRAYSSATGASFISWEYPGYGPRPGPCTAAEMKADIVALYDHLIVTHKLRPHQISVMGHSIGSGPAVWLASQRPLIGGLILLSPYTSIRDIIAEWLPATWIAYACPTVFDNETAISQVTCPILFIHGKKDNVIPWTHTARLAEAAKHSLSKKICYAAEATHNNWRLDEDILGPLRAFFH
jgi:pimeloyl-ACP methyl ester carboxylesterase